MKKAARAGASAKSAKSGGSAAKRRAGEKRARGATGEKVECRTPTPGKAPTRIDAWKFDLVAGAIVAELPKGAPGVAFSELGSRVYERLAPAERARLGSLPWYLTTVKLELEVRGVIARSEGTPQRLWRT
jgi:hypothetical protein